MDDTVLMLMNPRTIHGVGMMNTILLKSKFCKKFKCILLPYVFSESQEEIGKINFKKIKNMFVIFRRLINTLRTENVTVVYRPIVPKGKAFIRDAIYILIIKIFGKPYVLHIHGRGIKEHYEKSSFLVKSLYRSIFGNASGVIVLGKNLVRDVDFMVNKDRIFIVPNGIPDIKNTKKSKKQPGTVLFLANMKKDKGPLTVLHSVPIVISKVPNIKFIFVGHWRDICVKRAFMNVKYKKQWGKYILYMGPKYKREKVEIFNESDIFAYPTENDAFPLVILEAMRAGLPVISTNIGAIPEIIDDGVTGFIIPPKDPKALGEKIIYLCEHPKVAERMGKEARKKYQEKYTLEIFEKNMLAVFEDVLKRCEDEGH